MSDIGDLRNLLDALPVTEDQLAPIVAVIDTLEEKILAGGAALIQLQSLHEVVAVRFFKRAEPCPFCRGVGRHTTSCYVPLSTGWNLLDEHENIVRENNELRAALAIRLPNNGKHIKPGRMSLKDRARIELPGG